MDFDRVLTESDAVARSHAVKNNEAVERVLDIHHPNFRSQTSPALIRERKIQLMRRQLARVRMDEIAFRKTFRPGEHVLYETALKHGLSLAEVVDRKNRPRQPKKVAARQEAWWRMRNELGLSYPQIGLICGGFDHTTILYGVSRHQKKRDLGG